jgi:hypothetical protein
MAQRGLIGSALVGVAAAGVGTLAMDLYWYVQYKRGGGESAFLDWEFAAPESWEKASAPARVGKLLYEATVQQDLPFEQAGTTNNVMHWGYGLQWGGVYGSANAGAESTGPLQGLLLGFLVWLASYGILPQLKVYKQIWEYDLPTLAKDLGGHLVYGLVTGLTYKALAGK